MEKLTSVKDALVFLIKGLFDSEKEVHEVLPDLISQLSEPTLIQNLYEYQYRESEKITAFQRLFELVNEPLIGRKNTTAFAVLHEVRDRLSGLTESSVKEKMLLRSLQIITDSKIADYITALHFARQLGLTEVVDLLLYLLKLENKTSKELALWMNLGEPSTEKSHH